jgi:hypothetical protein
LEIIVVVLILVALGYASTKFDKASRRKTPSARGNLERSVSSHREAATSRAEVASVSYDTGAFKSENGRFTFPKYSIKNAWVRVIDSTDYKSIWANMDREEKQEYGIAELEEEVKSGSLEFEVASFWEALKGAKKQDLGRFGAVAGSAEILNSAFDSCEAPSAEDGGGMQGQVINAGSALCKLLVEVGAAAQPDLSDPEILRAWLNTKLLSDLREMAKAQGLKVFGSKSEIIARLLSETDIVLLAKGVSFVITTDRFVEFISTLGALYIEQLRRQIENWHPLYVQAVWETVYETNEHEGLDFLLPHIAALKRAA